MNDALHWNNIAERYDHEIFNVFKNDKKKKLKKYLAKYANKENLAIDFGCGVGKALPLLSPLFKGVIAVDVSSKCISIAKEGAQDNVEFRQLDLAGKEVELPAVSFAFCCNVAMSDNTRRNEQIIRNVLQALNKGGVALFVLPSYESASFSALRLVNWYEREGVSLSDIPADELRLLNAGSLRQARNGILEIDGVRTKHYLATELYALFNSGSYDLTKLDSVEYGWETEFDSPPSWMQEPYPWDWVAEVKRVR